MKLNESRGGASRNLDKLQGSWLVKNGKGKAATRLGNEEEEESEDGDGRNAKIGRIEEHPKLCMRALSKVAVVMHKKWVSIYPRLWRVR